MPDVFAVPVFFICLRESLETSIIVSVLLTFLKQTLDGPERDAATYKRLVRQVWWGTGLGMLLCLCIGSGMIGAFYGIGTNVFSKAEHLWEGAFGLLATVVITVMGAALLRVSKLQDKWRVKLAKALEAKDSNRHASRGSKFKRFCEKYAMFLLPFITVLREGLEAVIFIGGVGLGLPPTSFPLAVICGLGAGALVGWLLYKGGSMARIQVFLIVSTCFLYMIAAGLFSKSVWAFQTNKWNTDVGGDAAETGSGPGSYDVRQSVWHVNCCNAQKDGGGGWGIFNSILGWQNSATYGSVISYNLYWVVISAWFVCLRFHEKHGRWPLMKAKSKPASGDESDAESGTILGDSREKKATISETAVEIRSESSSLQSA